MGLKLRLEWYNRETEEVIGEEYSNDLGKEFSVLGALGLPAENNINNGGFNVRETWVAILRPYFRHTLDITAYDYQIAFDYRDVW